MNNTLRLQPTPGSDANLPADQLSLLATQTMGVALQRLGGCPNCNGNALAPGGGADRVETDFNSPVSGVPNFGSWFAPEAPQAAGAPAAAAPSAPTDGPAQGNERSWTAEDEAALDRAIGGAGGGNPQAGEAANYDQIFSQFGQAQEGNCASVAVIKAALDKYKGKVFQQVQKTGDGYNVQLQDGKSVQVKKDELKKAAQAADFKGKPNEAKSMAVLMFAVMAKNAEKEGLGSFDQALKKLDNGFDPRKAAQLLGLGDKIRNVNPQEAARNGDAVVAWSPEHAVYSDGGKTDSYGQARAADGTDTRGHQLTQAFTFA